MGVRASHALQRVHKAIDSDAAPSGRTSQPAGSGGRFSFVVETILQMEKRFRADDLSLLKSPKNPSDTRKSGIRVDSASS